MKNTMGFRINIPVKGIKMLRAVYPFWGISLLDYRKQVKDLTERICHNVEGIEERSFTGKHLVHDIDIEYGWNNRIPVWALAHITNLRMVNVASSRAKGKRNVVSSKNAWILKLKC